MKKIILFILILLKFVTGKELFFGWYGYDPKNMVGWTNIAHSNNMSLLVNNLNLKSS